MRCTRRSSSAYRAAASVGRGTEEPFRWYASTNSHSRARGSTPMKSGPPICERKLVAGSTTAALRLFLQYL